MKYVLATHNPGKLKEMGAILARFGVEVVSPKELGITVDEVRAELASRHIIDHKVKQEKMTK